MWQSILHDSPVFLPTIICIVLVFFHKKLLKKEIKQLKYKDLQIDFTDLDTVRSNGESKQLESFRTLLLKQILYTQEFAFRFQPLVSTLVKICRNWDNKYNENQDIKYPSLQHSTEALNRFRDLTINSRFNFVINWETPLYDKVESNYRKMYIENIGKQHDINIANLMNDIKKPLPKMTYIQDIVPRDFESINKEANKATKKLRNIDHKPNDFEEAITETITCIEDYQNLITNINNIMEAHHYRYDYSMDIANKMYELLLYWNEYSPRIEKSETNSILAIVYKNLSLWLIRNDLPLSQDKLNQYLDIHTDNLIAILHEELLSQIPYYNPKMLEKALIEEGITDLNFSNYVRNAIMKWIEGIQQIRFGKNIFLGTVDYKEENKE